MKQNNNKAVIAIITVCICIIAAVGIVIGVTKGKNKKKSEKYTGTSVGTNNHNSTAEDGIHVGLNLGTGNVTGHTTENTTEDIIEIPETTASNIEDFDENEVVLCERKILTDPTTGVAVMSLLVPQGWNSSVQVDWSYVNQTSPGRAFVVLSSPDEKISITYVSHMPFVQTNSDNYVGNYNMNYMGVATELDYMTAYEYSMHMLERGKVTMLTSESTYIDSTKLDNIYNYAYQLGFNEYQYVKESVDYTMQGVTTMWASVDLTDYDGQVCIQHGTSNINGKSGYTETICEEIMYEITTTNYTSTAMGVLEYPSIVKTWNPYLFTIANFSDEATYIENYDLYRFLVANMVLCADFEYLNFVLGSQYVEQAVQANIEVTNYAYDVMNQYQQETMQQEEAFVNNFSDYIYDQTTYTLSDGAQVAVPTSADYVYSNGSDVVWSNTASYEPGSDYVQIY